MKEPLPFNNIVHGTHIYPVKPGTGFSDPPDYQKYWEGLLSKNLPLFIGEFGPMKEIPMIRHRLPNI